MKIHASNITKHGDIDFEAVVKLSDGFNGADLRNVCTEAGIRFLFKRKLEVFAKISGSKILRSCYGFSVKKKTMQVKL